jgi:hypothetical protein
MHVQMLLPVSIEQLLPCAFSYAAGNMTALVNDPTENPLELCYVSGSLHNDGRLLNHFTRCMLPHPALLAAAACTKSLLCFVSPVLGTLVLATQSGMSL